MGPPAVRLRCAVVMAAEALAVMAVVVVPMVTEMVAMAVVAMVTVVDIAAVGDMAAAVMALEGLVATWVMALEAAVSEATTEGTEVVAPRELAAARLLERKQPSRQRSGNVPCRHSSAA